MAGWAVPRLLTVTGLLVLWTAPPCVDPQIPSGGLQTPNIRDSLRLINILINRRFGPQSVRRECRTLNSTEFERITEVINRAKRDTRIRPNVYDAFAYLHVHPDINAGAHEGPGFLPFHRVLMFFLGDLERGQPQLFEKLLRMYDPTVSLCYWDSTLEPPDMASSAWWSSTYFGNHQDNVVTGFAANWNTPLGRLRREGGTIGRPFTRDDIRQVLARSTLGEISFPGGNIESNLEEKHNYVHSFVGGYMGKVETASYDPVFWFHHNFIDCIYEWFRQTQKQKGVNPMRDWPAEFGYPAHSPFASMRLGSLRMIDGANDYFPDNLFRCEDPPRECARDSDCRALHLRCDQGSGLCVSDTLAVRPRPDPRRVNSLGSLLERFDGLSRINSLLTAFPTRGFNQLFQAPTIDSFNLFSRGGDSGSGGGGGGGGGGNDGRGSGSSARSRGGSGASPAALSFSLTSSGSLLAAALNGGASSASSSGSGRGESISGLRKNPAENLVSWN